MNKYYENNKELVTAKNHLRYAIERKIKNSIVYADSLTPEERKQCLKENVAMQYRITMNRCHSINDIINETKKINQELGKYMNKDNELTPRQKDYIKNRKKCMAQSTSYTRAKKALQGHENDPDYDKNFNDLRQKIFDEVLKEPDRPYKARTKYHRTASGRPRRLKKLVYDNKPKQSTTATADTIITIAGDVRVEPVIHVDPAPMQEFVYTKNNKKYTDISVKLENYQFIIFILSILGAWGALIYMFLH